MCLQPGFLQQPGRISPNQPIQRAWQQCPWQSSARFSCLSPPLFTRAGFGVGTSVPSSLHSSCPKMPCVPPGHHLSPLVTTCPSWPPPFPPRCHLLLLDVTFPSWMPFPPGHHLSLLPIPTVMGGDDESTPLTHLVPFPDPAAAKPSLGASRGAQHHPTPHVTSQKNPFGHQPHPVAPRPPHPASSQKHAMLRDEAGRATHVS